MFFQHPRAGRCDTGIFLLDNVRIPFRTLKSTTMKLESFRIITVLSFELAFATATENPGREKKRRENGEERNAPDQATVGLRVSTAARRPAICFMSEKRSRQVAMIM